MNLVKRFAPLILVFAVGVVCWLIISPEPPIVRELRTMPEVGQVEHKGPFKPKLTVLHLCDLGWEPGKANEGPAYQNLLKRLEKAQDAQVQIIRRLIFRHKIDELYCDLSRADLVSLNANVDALRDLTSTVRKLDRAEMAHVRELERSIGVPGRLLLVKEITILPLEDDGGIKNGIAKDFPKSGLAVVLVGGDHDLAPRLPAGTLYVRVTPKSYPQ